MIPPYEVHGTLLPLKDDTHQPAIGMFYYKNKHQNEQRNSDNETHQGGRDTHTKKL